MQRITAAIKPVLEAYGFELIDDKRMRIIEQIKVAVIELVHYNDNSSKTNLSDYLTDKCHHDYSFLASCFPSEWHKYRKILHHSENRTYKGTVGV